MRQLEMHCWLPAPVDEVFDYCASQAGFLEQFPFPVRWLTGPEHWQQGDTLDFRYRVGGLWLRHQARIVAFEPGRRFMDVAEPGFYKVFRHQHRFEPDGDGARVIDTVDFSLGYGDWLDRSLGMATLKRAFRQRHAALHRHFEGDGHGYRTVS